MIDMSVSSSSNDEAPITSILPIHPSNYRLFPNLGAIWRNFQQYSFRRFNIRADPQASSLASGSYLLATVANDSSENVFPIFGTLANLATSAISTIWRPMVYKAAGNVLHRLGSYLINSAEPTTASPGSIAVSFSPGTSTNSADPALTPLFTVEAELHLRDFQPAKITEATNFGYAGYGWSTTRGAYFSLIGTYEYDSALPTVTLAPASATQQDLCTFSGCSGDLIIILRY